MPLPTSPDQTDREPAQLQPQGNGVSDMVVESNSIVEWLAEPSDYSFLPHPPPSAGRCRQPRRDDSTSTAEQYRLTGCEQCHPPARLRQPIRLHGLETCLLTIHTWT